jgi:hypothetical protein
MAAFEKVTMSFDCARHFGPTEKPCDGRIFVVQNRRQGAEIEYRCLTCGAVVVGDGDCLVMNRRTSKNE